MLSPTQASEICAKLIERAKRAGADAADASYSADASQNIQIRLGRLEDVERSESQHASLRVFVGKKSASIGSSDIGDSALDELAKRAVLMAQAAPDDPFAGLAPEEMLFKGTMAELELSDPADPSPEALRDDALKVEQAARAVSGVTNSEGGNASTSRVVVGLATSHGFMGGYQSSSHGISASVIAGEGAAMQRDYAWRAARYRCDLPCPEEIGKLAGERAVRRLSPSKVKSGPMPVVFAPRVSGGLLGHLLGAITGPAIARRASFMLDRLEDQIFDSSITVIDNPLQLRGLRSRPFDGEGLPVAVRKIVENGKVTGWLADSASARQLGIMPTGHASRGGSGAPSVSVSNVHMEAGTVSPGQLISDIAEGVYVTELIGHGVNGVTGDYSRGASGYVIRNGEIGGPVAEFTVAGNLVEIYKSMIAADDLEMFRMINAPTLRVDSMTVAGD